MNKMSEEEKKRIRETPIQELLESGEWVKLYDAINPSLKLYDYSCHRSNKTGDKDA